MANYDTNCPAKVLDEASVMFREIAELARAAHTKVSSNVSPNSGHVQYVLHVQGPDMQHDMRGYHHRQNQPYNTNLNLLIPFHVLPSHSGRLSR